MKIHQPLNQSDIYTGPVSGLGKVLEKIDRSSCFILADDNTARLCVPLLENIDHDGLIVIPSGEKHKNLESCELIWSHLVDHKADRNSTLINVGGGMICDLGGFSASCYQRGMTFINVPTSVLAMADAALGGKNGVDYKGLKNYLGVIRLPYVVWIDNVFINTLPRIEKISGLAEIVKHAIIASKEMWDILSTVTSPDDIPWDTILEKNHPVKLAIIEEDLHEGGKRKILNFGHTIGHALESYFLSSGIDVTHGQSVTLGMLAEAKIANLAGLLNNTDFNAIVNMVERLLEPLRISFPTFDELNFWLLQDKKKSG